MRERGVLSVILLALVLLACGLATPRATLAEGISWRRIGPDGGNVGAIAADPSNPGTVYAGADGWVFKSTDGGLHWERLNGLGPPYTSLPGPPAACLGGTNGLLVDPQRPQVIFTMCHGWGVTKTEDGGASWKDLFNGYYGWPKDLAIDPQHTDTLYLADADDGVFKTTDGGAHWVQTGLVNVPVAGVAVDPLTPAIVYAATAEGAYKTTDGGANWLPANNGLPEARVAYDVAVDPVTPLTLYLSVNGTVMKSVDGAASWEATGSELAPGEAVDLVVDPLRHATVYASFWTGEVYRSTDGGDHWRALEIDAGAFGTPDTLALAPQATPQDPLAPSAVYFGAADTGVARSTDGGAHWELANQGMFIDKVGLVAAFPPLAGSASGAPSTLYAKSGSVGGGLVASTDGGAHWRNAWADNGWADIHNLVADPQAPGTLYASPGAFIEWIGKSTDAGLSWTWSLLPGADAGDWVAIDPLNPATLYAAPDVNHICKSTDGGAAWRCVAEGFSQFADVERVEVDPQHPQVVYASTYESLYRSMDYGNHFSRVDLYEVGLGGLGPPATDDPGGLAVLYSWDSDEFFTSADGGDHWTAISSTVPSLLITSFIADPQAPGTLYVSTQKGGVLLSTDGGRNFRAINRDLPTLDVRSLALDPQTPGVLYAGTYGFGLYVSGTAPETQYLPLVSRTP